MTFFEKLFVAGCVAGSLLTANAQAQEAVPTELPHVLGTIHIMYMDGTTNKFLSDVKYFSKEECYLAGMPAAADIVLHVPVIAYYIECVVEGSDV